MNKVIQEHFSSYPPDKLLLFPGQYGVYRKILSPDLTIFTTPEKSSTILMIELPGYGLGIANIDTPAHATAATKKIITRLRELVLGKKARLEPFCHQALNMKATLIGASSGDFVFNGFPFGRDKHLICYSICKELEENKIPFSHRLFSFGISSLFLPTIYLSLYLLRLVDSDASYLKLSVSLMVCFVLQLYINPIFSQQKLTLETDGNYYVKVKVATNELKIIYGKKYPDSLSLYKFNFENRMFSNVFFTSMASLGRSLNSFAGIPDELIDASVPAPLKK